MRRFAAILLLVAGTSLAQRSFVPEYQVSLRDKYQFSVLRPETNTLYGVLTWIDEHWTDRTGPQGPIGPVGPAGTNGVNGLNGLNGLNGTNGIDGAGIDDIYVIYDGLVEEGYAYSLYIDWNNWTELEIFPFVAPFGPQGETGATGGSGADGANGINGVDGEDGAPGIGIANITLVDGGVVEAGYAYDLVILMDDDTVYAPTFYAPYGPAGTNGLPGPNTNFPGLLETPDEYGPPGWAVVVNQASNALVYTNIPIILDPITNRQTAVALGEDPPLLDWLGEQPFVLSAGTSEAGHSGIMGSAFFGHGLAGYSYVAAAVYGLGEKGYGGYFTTMAGLGTGTGLYASAGTPGSLAIYADGNVQVAGGITVTGTARIGSGDVFVGARNGTNALWITMGITNFFIPLGN